MDGRAHEFTEAELHHSVAGCALGLLTGEGAALGEAAVAADEIRGTVQSAHGAEAGVWVIAETQDFQTRFAKIVVTERRPHAVAQGRRQRHEAAGGALSSTALAAGRLI
jgi:hypothetical protein